jgi:hypothetical protein
MKWKGPFKINELLDNCLEDTFPKPPEKNSVYVVSKLKWDKEPTEDCILLYVGSYEPSRNRLGDLIATMFGITYQHSGGETGYQWCKEQKLNPKELYIGWLEGQAQCVKCTESIFYDRFHPKWNKKRPSCKKHNR